MPWLGNLGLFVDLLEEVGLAELLKLEDISGHEWRFRGFGDADLVGLEKFELRIGEVRLGLWTPDPIWGSWDVGFLDWDSIAVTTGLGYLPKKNHWVKVSREDWGRKNPRLIATKRRIRVTLNVENV